MSEVEHIVICDDTEVIDSSTSHNDFLVEITNKIVESHITNIIVPLEEPLVNVVEEIKENEEMSVIEKVSDSNISEASFAVDAFVEDIGRNVAFFIDEIVSDEQTEVYESLEVIEEVKVRRYLSNSIYMFE